MRFRLFVLSILLAAATSAMAQHVSIGINLTAYPDFVRVPGYPVYYAPRVRENIFFYDGLYWVFADDRWYSSTWYNGPWYLVDPLDVPVYVLRVPVRYYHYRPAYFSGWALDAAPRWGTYWGPTWEQRRIGWDRWNRNAVPAAAPLPLYQRAYAGSRYPSTVEQQSVITTRQYRYQPRDTAARRYYREFTTTTTSTSNVAGAKQSAREFAPGQVKQREGAQSAREFAPGHVKRQQAQIAAAPPQPRGHGRGHRQDEPVEAEGQGHGHGHGRGHNKD